MKPPFYYNNDIVLDKISASEIFNIPSHTISNFTKRGLNDLDLELKRELNLTSNKAYYYQKDFIAYCLSLDSKSDTKKRMLAYLDIANNDDDDIRDWSVEKDKQSALKTEIEKQIKSIELRIKRKEVIEVDKIDSVLVPFISDMIEDLKTTVNNLTPLCANLESQALENVMNSHFKKFFSKISNNFTRLSL